MITDRMAKVYVVLAHRLEGSSEIKGVFTTAEAAQQTADLLKADTEALDGGTGEFYHWPVVESPLFVHMGETTARSGSFTKEHTT